MQPLDLAVYWIEHVLKHKGAPHLQNAGLRLNWLQAYLLDVIVFNSIVFAMLFCVIFVIAKMYLLVFKKLYRKKKRKTN